MKKFLPALLLAAGFSATAQTVLLDETFNVGTGTNFNVLEIKKLADGKIMISGNFDTYNGTPAHGIARINPDGSIDTTFSAEFGGNLVTDFVIEPDGKIMIVSEFGGIMRLNADGSLDTSFTSPLGLEVSSIVKQGDKYIVTGDFTRYTPEAVMYQNLIRLNSDGSIDDSFTSTSFFDYEYAEILQQADGKLLLTGTFTHYKETEVNHIVRLNADGSIDETFDTGTGANHFIRGAAQQPDGKYIITGIFTSFNGQPAKQMVRLNNDGSRDNSFAYSTTIGLPDDSILGFDIAFEGDGKILVGGSFLDAMQDIEGTPDGSIPVRLVRLNTDGSNDITFDLGAGFNDSVYAISLIEDFATTGLYAGGQFTSYNGVEQKTLARLHENVMGNQNHTAKGVMVYPNPVGERLFVTTGDSAEATVKIIDVTGKRVKDAAQAGHNGFDVSGLAPGIYFAEITLGDKVEVQKIIKQ